MSDITVGSVWLEINENNEIYTVKNIALNPDDGLVYVVLDKMFEGWSIFSKKDFLRKFKPRLDMVNQPPHYKDNSPKAVQILNEAVSIMAERGKSYDKSGGEAERSMPKIVAMFNALTGHELTPEQGWKFMCCLKLARSEQGEYREDNYLDGAAYMALAGEEAEASCE